MRYAIVALLALLATAQARELLQSCKKTSDCGASGFICKNKQCVACGAPGQACCQGSTQCADGQKCKSAKCPVAPPACGAKDQACCKSGGKACKLDTLMCSAGTCVDCGIEGAPCCKETKCESGKPSFTLTCANTSKTCVACGQLGQACCQESKCGSSALVCDATAAPAPSCVECGALGQMCCKDAKCLPGNTCGSDGFCAAAPAPLPPVYGSSCGGLDQKCCAESDTTAACTSTSDLQMTCRKGLCKKCGAADTPCCNGNMCGLGTTCKSSFCLACGQKGQVCCAGNKCNGGARCKSGVCK